jgi:hypothetical protein
MKELSNGNRKEERSNEGGQSKGRIRAAFASVKKTAKEGLMALGVAGTVASGGAALSSGCSSENTDNPVPMSDASPDSNLTDGGVTDREFGDKGVDTGPVKDNGPANDVNPPDVNAVDATVDSGNVDTGVADSDVDAGVADADVDSGLCGGATGVWGPGLMNQATPKKVGDYVFYYLGENAAEAPVWDVKCTGGETVVSGLVGVELGEMIYQVAEDNAQIRIVAGIVGKMAVNCTIHVEPIPSGG